VSVCANDKSSCGTPWLLLGQYGLETQGLQGLQGLQGQRQYAASVVLQSTRVGVQGLEVFSLLALQGQKCKY
jgi:hypothetical protein